MTSLPAGAATRHERDYLVRSEERLDVRTVAAPAGRVRLEKFVVIEDRTFTVQVTREDFRLVRYDIDGTATTLDAAQIQSAGRASGAEVGAGGSADHRRWLTLSEERVIITKEVVALERVRLEVETVTEQRQVTEEVRAERIEFEPNSAPPGNGDHRIG